jgi:TRAP-type C4-dicarboxylate transport system permease small subunit
METFRALVGIADPPCRRLRWLMDRILLWFCMAVLIAIAIIIIVAVVSRSLGASLSWYDEVSQNLLAWLTFYGSGLAVLRGAHLDFSAFVRKLPPVGRLTVMFTAKAITMSFFAVMAYAGMDILDLMRGETLVTLEWIPMPLVQSALPIGAMVFIVAELATIPTAIIAIIDDAAAEAAH